MTKMTKTIPWDEALGAVERGEAVRMRVGAYEGPVEAIDSKLAWSGCPESSVLCVGRRSFEAIGGMFSVDVDEHDVSATDLSRYQRLIATEGRVSGTWWAMHDGASGQVWVKPVDVTVYHEGRRSGRVLYSGDLTASVTGGEVDLREYMVASHKLDAVRDAWREVIDAIASVAVVMVEREDEDDE